MSGIDTIYCARCRRPSLLAEHWRWARLVNVAGVEVGRVCLGCVTLGERRELDAQRECGQRPRIEVVR